MRQNPHAEWTYREMGCRLYKHFDPDGFDWAGYVKVGDEWQKAGPMLGASDEDTARSRVEDYVDKIIMMAKIDNINDDGDTYDPIDIDPPGDPYPFPEPEPVPAPVPGPGDPDPVPQPPNPIWIREDRYRTWDTDETDADETGIYRSPGTVEVRTVDDGTVTCTYSSLWDEEFEDGKLAV